MDRFRSWNYTPRWLLGAASLVWVALVTEGCRDAGPDQGQRLVKNTETTDAAPSVLRANGIAPEDLFGLVGDVAVASDGQAFVLDVVSKQVGIFNASGQRTAALGREGDGPGEFSGPVALAVDDRNDVFVLDERSQRVTVFSGDGGAYRRSFPLDFHPRDLCFLAGRLYVLGVRDAHLIHEVSPADGKVVRSFAPDPESRDMLLAGYRGGGHLACGREDEIVFLPALRPDVAVYEASSGTHIATARIPEYRGIRVTRTASGSVTFEALGGVRNDNASSIVPLGPGAYLVQVGQLRPRSMTDHEFQSIRSYLLTSGNGQIVPISADGRRVMAMHRDRVLVVTTEPYPSVAFVPNTYGATAVQP